MNARKIIYSIHFVLILLAAFANVVAQTQQGPLSKAVQTHKQKERGVLYGNYGKKDQKLTDGEGNRSILGEGHVPLHSTLPQRLEVFRKMACRSDGVILGKVTNQESLLTPDETFIYTEASVAILEVLKDNPNSHLYAGREITVTRPGGSVEWNGRKLTARLAEFRHFSNGSEYLLFLNFLPATQDYQAFGNQSFELRGQMVLSLTRELLWETGALGGQGGSSALADARQAVQGPCK